MNAGIPVESPRYLIIKLPGSGDENVPYEINSLAVLEVVSHNSDLWDKYFIQTANIDASDTKLWNSNAGFSPIGNQTIPFTGQYDGGDYVIESLFINRPDEDGIGLFGVTFIS